MVKTLALVRIPGQKWPESRTSAWVYDWQQRCNL
jgi:hypothetical protein